jgi:nitrite reductase (NADH) small subunit/3-phenylpropionate/trans-cinnamate dioxygenase ferredoxin subunit
MKFEELSEVSGTYQTIAKVGEIPEGEGRPFEVDGRMIAVFLESAVYYAIDDACPHQGSPLCDGMVESKSVTCTWHGWRFSLEDGRWLDSPKSKVRVGSYPVRVEGEEIQVLV